MAKTKSCKVAGAWMKDEWPDKVKEWLKDNLSGLSVQLDREAAEFVVKHGVGRDGDKDAKQLRLFIDLNNFKENDRQPDFALKVPSDQVAYDAFAAARKARFQGGAQAAATPPPAEPEDDLPF